MAPVLGTPEQESPLVAHAQRELATAGFYDADADYGPGAIAGGVMELVQAFAKQGHSGHSASLTRHLFDLVANFKVLSRLTSAPNEWMDVAYASGRPMWQSTRQSSCFSTDGGQTYYDIDEKLPAPDAALTVCKTRLPGKPEDKAQPMGAA